MKTARNYIKVLPRQFDVCNVGITDVRDLLTTPLRCGLVPRYTKFHKHRFRHSKLNMGDTDTDTDTRTHRQVGELTSSLTFFQDKQSMLRIQFVPHRKHITSPLQSSTG
jgi:hypothetical protein